MNMRSRRVQSGDAAAAERAVKNRIEEVARPLREEAESARRQRDAMMAKLDAITTERDAYRDALDALISLNALTFKLKRQHRG